MDDMTAFERQLSSGLGQMAGPGRDIDAMAMARTVSTQSPKWRFQSMFSATKFVAAGVIVALFGGFLLAGVLTTPQGDEVLPAAASASPTGEATSEPTETPTTSVRTDILPGVDLTVEEVGPGVFRVANDGVRDLVFGSNTGMAAGHDGGVWLLRKNQFFRLGSDEWHEREDSQPVNDFLVAPDGTAWTIEDVDSWLPMARLRSFDGETWTTHHDTTPSAALDVDADGKVWAAWLQKAAPLLHIRWPSDISMAMSGSPSASSTRRNTFIPPSPPSLAQAMSGSCRRVLSKKVALPTFSVTSMVRGG